MSKSKILGLTERPQSIPPIIEIVGPVDIGKKFVAQLVARKLGGRYISFPKIFTNEERGFPASLSLFRLLHTNPQLLEAEFEWWAHQYVSSFYERRAEISELREQGPLIVTNYTAAYRVWMKAAGMNMPQFMNGFTRGLPKPDRVYCLYGEAWDRLQANMTVNFSPGLISRVNTGMLATTHCGAVKVPFSQADSKFRHVVINKAAHSIAADAAHKFGLEVDLSQVYTKEHFPQKDMK